MGSARRFEDTRSLIGAIRCCSINANGHKVGIISNKLTSSGSAASHSFHIYDTDQDNFVEYNVGEEKIPIAIHWDQKETRYFGVQVECSKSDASKDEEENEEEEEREDDDDEDT